MTHEQDIKTLLTIGENIVIEFKRAGNGPEHDTFESICAFLNRQGGDVLLGVTDDGKVIGVPPKAAPAMVRQIVNVMNDPNLWEPRIASLRVRSRRGSSLSATRCSRRTPTRRSIQASSRRQTCALIQRTPS